MEKSIFTEMALGVPSPEMVEKRAREIAMIDERNPDEFTEEPIGVRPKMS